MMKLIINLKHFVKNMKIINFLIILMMKFNAQEKQIHHNKKFKEEGKNFHQVFKSFIINFSNILL